MIDSYTRWVVWIWLTPKAALPPPFRGYCVWRNAAFLLQVARFAWFVLATFEVAFYSWNATINSQICADVDPFPVSSRPISKHRVEEGNIGDQFLKAPPADFLVQHLILPTRLASLIGVQGFIWLLFGPETNSQIQIVTRRSKPWMVILLYIIIYVPWKQKCS